MLGADQVESRTESHASEGSRATLCEDPNIESLDRISLKVVLLHDILWQSDVFDGEDESGTDWLLDKLCCSGWTEVRTLREVLLALATSSDRPSIAASHAYSMLSVMRDLKPEEIVLMDAFEWVPEGREQEMRILSELVT